jgi:hypothetical protein
VVTAVGAGKRQPVRFSGEPSSSWTLQTGESSPPELAPRMLSRLERRRPAPTVPSRTLVCRYLSAPVSAMPLVSYSGRSVVA